MQEFLAKAKSCMSIVATLDGKRKNKILNEMADALLANGVFILEENQKDMEAGRANNLEGALLDRLLLDEKRLEAIAQSLRDIAVLREPVGRILDGWVTDDNIRIEKVSVPIGVVGVIYESRPNVTSDVAGLCFKSGNVAILKGGKEAEHSNQAIAKTIQEVLVKNKLPKEIISLLPDATREGVAKLIREDAYVDLIVPRGGEALIKYISKNASVPVVKHDKGLCHTYIHRDASPQKAINIAINAKCHRPGVCNAMETLILDKQIAKTLLPSIYKAFVDAGTKLKGCARTREFIFIDPATENDFNTEYLSNQLNIKVVEGIEEAIAHIQKFGSGHSEAIITENYSASEMFMNVIDAACVYVNASTRFTDGGAFGFGAEVGISTNKLHARGPMGVNELTTYKFKLYGNGQIRK